MRGSIGSGGDHSSSAQVPHIPPRVVRRPRLDDRLAHVWSHPVSVVVAPAGYGKTTVVAQWAAAQPPGRVVWLGLEPGDHDPARFARHLGGVLAGLDPPILCPSLTAQRPQIGIGGDRLIEEVASAVDGKEPIVLVLDDLHTVAGSAVSDAIGALAAQGVAGLHLLLVSRREPPWPLHRRRLSGGVVEIRQDDLVFSTDEAASLVAKVGARLDTTQVDMLVERTEGWAVGLQLAAVTLRDAGPASDFLKALYGADSHVVEYLTEEVLDGLDPHTRAAVLRVSVLDEVDAGLAVAVTDHPRGVTWLPELAMNSIFVSALDVESTRFRFHRLFAQLLRARLHLEDGGEVVPTLQRAAAVLEARGDIVRAGTYLRRAGDWEGLLSLVRRCGRLLYERGETATMAFWMRDLPAEHHTSVEVTLMEAQILAVDGAAAVAESLVAGLVRRPLSGPERAIAQTIRSGLVLFGSDPALCLDAGHIAIDLIEASRDDSWPRLVLIAGPSDALSVATFASAWAALALDRLEEAHELAARAASVVGAYPPWRVNSLGTHAVALALRGELDTARERSAAGLRVAGEAGLEHHLSIAICHLADGIVAQAAGDHASAQRSLDLAVPLLRSNRRDVVTALAASLDAEVAAARGDPQRAMELVRMHRDELETVGRAGVASWLDAAEARALLDLKREAEAEAILARGRGTMLLPLRARLAAERGDAPTLRRLLDTPVVPSSPRKDLERDLWLAVADDIEGNEAAAAERLAGLAPTVLASRSHGTLVSGGRTVRGALRRAAEHKPTPSLRSLRQVVDLATPHPGDVQTTLVDALTERELELLTFLPTRLSNAEIADAVHLSHNTIKTHMAHIYRKLAATSRSEAISRAEELGLL